MNEYGGNGRKKITFPWMEGGQIETVFGQHPY